MKKSFARYTSTYGHVIVGYFTFEKKIMTKGKVASRHTMLPFIVRGINNDLGYREGCL